MALVAWYPLNGTLKDLTGLMGDLTMTNTSVNTMTSNGIVNKTYTNTSHTSGTMLSANKINLGSNQSMFCWIYMDDIYSSASLNAIMGQHRYNYNSDRGCNMGITIKYISSTTGYLSVNTGSSSGRTYNTYCGSTVLTTGRWYHVGYTYDGSTIKLYVNGILDGQHSVSNLVFGEDYFGAYMWSLQGTSLGTKEAHGNYVMTGRINDARVYNHTVAESEVLAIMASGKNSEVARGLRFGVSFDETCSNYAGPEQPYEISNITYDTTDVIVGRSSANLGTNGHVFTRLDSYGWKRCTIMAWIKLSAYASERSCVMIGGFYLTVNSSGKISVYCYGKNGGYWDGNSTVPLNTWTHIAAVWSDSGLQLYMNGVKDSSLIASTGNTTPTDGREYHYKKDIGYESGYGRQFSGKIGEVLMYNNDLSETEIKEIINVKKRLYRSGSSESRALNETAIETSAILKNGTQRINYLSEVVELDDGSYWLQVQHHNNKSGTNLFSSSDAFETSFVYHNDECWSAFPLIKQYGSYNSRYEFIALDQPDRQTGLTIRRWAQTSSPFTASWNDIKAGSSGFTAIQNIPTMNGGMYRGTSSTAYMRIANANSDNWYGAFGCFTDWSGRIPTFNNTANYGILDLYVRVSPENAKKYREFKKGIIMPSTFNEI